MLKISKDSCYVWAEEQITDVYRVPDENLQRGETQPAQGHQIPCGLRLFLQQCEHTLIAPISCACHVAEVELTMPPLPGIAS